MEEEKKHIKETDSFTAVSHYIKSPIYILKGYLEALFSEDLGELNEKQKNYIKVCLENVDKVNTTIGGLVRVMEIENGRYEVKKEPVDITKEIKDVVEDNWVLAKASNAKIFMQTQEEPIFVLTDKEKIKETLNALLMNAIKYKAQKEGRIDIRIEKKGEKMLFFIKNNGVSISDEEKEKIFNKFYRTKEAVRVDPNSLGLELYICKIVIEESGGEIWMEKDNEERSSFFFTLPLYKKEN